SDGIFSGVFAMHANAAVIWRTLFLAVASQAPAQVCAKDESVVEARTILKAA
ncbi:MAG: hypothetical protein JWM11_1449, partial [Planctomycetaceae bacterium]|nr:hypothetical protein [Planctomycetaceae bacterium]